MTAKKGAEKFPHWEKLIPTLGRKNSHTWEKPFEVSEIKEEVKMEINSLRSWKLKWTIQYGQTASKAIVQPAALA